MVNENINNEETQVEKKLGRPPFRPTKKERELVEILSGRGLSIELISSLVRDGIDNDTLKKHFSHELLIGKAKTGSRISEKLIEKALDGDTQALIWFTKAQLKWAEASKLQLSGDDEGAPIQIAKIERVIIDNGKAKDSTD